MPSSNRKRASPRIGCGLSGFLVIAVSNLGDIPVALYADQGTAIAHARRVRAPRKNLSTRTSLISSASKFSPSKTACHTSSFSMKTGPGAEERDGSRRFQSGDPRYAMPPLSPK